MRLVTLVPTLLALAGCAILTTEGAAKMSDADLCFAYYSRAAQSAEKTIASDEIGKRGIAEVTCREHSRQKQLILDKAVQSMREAPSY